MRTFLAPSKSMSHRRPLRMRWTVVTGNPAMRLVARWIPETHDAARAA